MPTSTYWAKRILADEKRAQALTSRAARKTQQAYRASYKRVLREMEGLYAQAQSGGAVTRTQLWRYSHWRGMTEELRKFASSGAALEEQRLTKVLDQVFSNTIGADVKAFGQKQWRTRLNASSVVNTAWSGENYSTRIWRNRALLASRVREEVTQAVLDGKPVNRIAADLQSAFSSSWSQAERLARTETSYVFNQASLRRYAELGIRQVRWITGINDGRECEVCAERSGQVYDLNNAPMMPAHPNCRCAWGAVVAEREAEEVTSEEAPSELKQKLDAIHAGEPTEQERERLKSFYPNTVSLKALDAPEFTDRFRGITQNEATDKAVYECAVKSLVHRNGTNGEDLYLINGRTGEVLYANTGSSGIKTVNYDAETLSAIEKAHTEGVQIIALHNHPNGMPPSLDDGSSAFVHGYDKGVVVGHNLEVWEYSGTSEFITQDTCREAHELLSTQLSFSVDFDENAWYTMLRSFGMEVGRK